METNRSKEPQESGGTDIKPDTDGTKANAPPAGQKPDAAPAGVNPVRRWTFIVLAVCAILLIYHLIADFLTPYTSQAYVQAFVVDIAPEVAGAVVEVNVVDNAEVKAGQKLFRIDPTPFRNEAAALEAQLAQARSKLAETTAKLSETSAGVRELRESLKASGAQVNAVAAKAGLARRRVDQNRELVAAGAGSLFDLERAEADLKELQAQFESARASEAQVVHKLSAQSQGDQASVAAAKAQIAMANAQVAAVEAQFADVKRKLDETTVLAPADGLITNLKLSIGQVVPAGTPVMTFVDTRTGWIVAELREKSLGNLQRGDKAEVALDGLPGQVFPAHVESIAWGVSAGTGRDSSGLPTVSEQKDWLRGSQRFPVLLAADVQLPRGAVRVGSLARVVVYSGDNAIMNGLAWLYIRMASWFGYVI